MASIFIIEKNILRRNSKCFAFGFLVIESSMKWPCDRKYFRSHKGLIESFISLSALNGINVLLPLITIPYLIRTIGLSKYGAYSIAYTILQYVLLISTYGFCYTATKQVAQNRDNTDYIGVIFHSTIIARIVLSIPSIFAGLLFTYLVYPIDYTWMYIGGIGIILGDVLNPVWLFQGFEKMRYMTYVNVVCKLFFTILIFLFVRTEDDYVYITLWNSLGFIVSGILSYYISFKVFKLKFVRVEKSDVVYQIKDSWSIFLSTVFMNLYRNSNIFLLGFFVSEYSVGVYSAAEKVVKAVQSVTAPVSNALFPYLSASFKGRSTSDCSRQILSLNRRVGYLFAGGTLLFFLTAGIINQLFFGNTDPKITELMRWMSPVLLIGSMNYVLGISGLVNINYNSFFLKAVTISGVLSILLLIISVSLLDIYSGAISMVLAEVILFVMCYSKLFKLTK